MSGEVPRSINLDWPNRLAIDRTAFQRAVLPRQVDTSDDTAQIVLELTHEIETDIKKRYPELDEDNQRQAAD